MSDAMDLHKHLNVGTTIATLESLGTHAGSFTGLPCGHDIITALISANKPVKCQSHIIHQDGSVEPLQECCKKFVSAKTGRPLPALIKRAKRSACTSSQRVSAVER